MQVYAYELTVETRGTVTLNNLPFNAGAKLEVIIIPRPHDPPYEEKRYPFWGKPISYIDPTAPVAEVTWEVLR